MLYKCSSVDEPKNPKVLEFPPSVFLHEFCGARSEFEIDQDLGVEYSHFQSRPPLGSYTESPIQ
jgi:hypothetical protein